MKINYVAQKCDWLASYRYHIKTPARELEKLGHKVLISEYPANGYDIYIFHKHLRYEDYELMLELKRNGKRTAYIVCDYHLDEKSKHRNHYKRMISGCDTLIVPTESMRKVVYESTGKDAFVIKDSWGIEYDWREPEFQNKECLSLLWYGHSTNIDGLAYHWNSLIGHKVILITSEDMIGKIKSDGVPLPIVPYSIENMKKGFSMCDAVIIPQNANDIKKSVKTPNRVVDSLRAGKFVVASPIDSYNELKDFIWVGDIKEGLDWLKQQPNEKIKEMISAGQEYINNEFNPEILAKKWEGVFVG